MTKKKDDYEEAKRFKAFRKYKGLSQKEVGDIIGKGQATIYRYETGEYLIPGRVVATLVNKLKLNHEWFYYGTGEMIAKNEPANIKSKSDSDESRAMLLEIRIEKLESKIRALELLVKQQTN